MPDAKMIMELGAMGCILFAFIYVILRGVPAVKAHIDGLVTEFRSESQEARATFKAEIEAERQITRELIQSYGLRLEKNTSAVDQLASELRQHVSKG